MLRQNRLSDIFLAILAPRVSCSSLSDQRGGGIPPSLLFLRSFEYLPTELYNSIKQWGPAGLQGLDNGNTLPDGNNPSPNSNGPQTGNPTPVEGDHDTGNPSLVPNGPAESDPKSYHTTTEHPPGISPAFKYFREFWCGAFEGRQQSVCCLGNEYGNFRSFAGELPCEKSFLLPPSPLFPPHPFLPSPISHYHIQSLKIRQLNLVLCRAMGSWRRYRDDNNLGYALSALLPRTKLS